MTPEEWRRLPTIAKNRLRAEKHKRRAAEREEQIQRLSEESTKTRPPEGSPIPNWRYLSGGPFFSRSLHPVDLSNLFRGAHCFLVLSGPSLKTMDLSGLRRRGIMTGGVNNSPAIVRPTIWTYVDPAFKFHDGIWRDPGVLKFVPVQHIHGCPLKQKVNGTIDWLWRDGKQGKHVYPADMPSVFGYRRNASMEVSRFLSEETITYGRDKKYGARIGKPRLISVFACVLKLLYALGIRDVYLLGADFTMSPERPYAFEQSKSVGGAVGCNRVFKQLDALCQELLPTFEEAGYRVWNCTPGSGLTAFPALDYTSALTLASGNVPQELDTANWYLS